MLMGMRKMKGLGLLAAAAVLLAGCASASPEQQFVAGVREDVPNLDDLGTEEQLIELGGHVCDALSDGESRDDVVNRYVELRFTEAEASAFVDNAESFLCT